MSSRAGAIRQYLKSCFPSCKIPDKRDFMDPDPARTSEDFYRDYDPWVGIGTAIILALFFVLIAVKTFLKWLLRRVTIWRYQYQKYHEEHRGMHNHLISGTTEPTTTLPLADNGHIILG